MTALLEFECRRSVDGYKIVSLDRRKLIHSVPEEDYWTVEPPANATDDERHLIKLLGAEVLPRDDEPKMVRYVVARSEKFEHFNLVDQGPASFLEFVHTPKTCKGVQAFADQYGLLRSGHGELVENWYWAIRRMSKAVAAWEHAEASGNFTKVVGLINHLKAGERGIRADLMLTLEPPNGAARLCIRPSDLEHALWMQLSLAIDGAQNFKPCVVCGAYFRLEAGGSRVDKEYCTDACRMRAYRNRKKGVK